ncbi:MAG: ShlB/FhaC/HecB family hemolysin secretion/activation protein, partial [Rhodanobacter sp.]
PLARAFIPAQTLDGGTVRIRVVEARYDQVRADNHSRVSDSLVGATLAPLHSGEVVKRSTLDRSLLLLGQLPGASPQATLSPGTSPGTSSLDVAVAATPTVQGSVSLDDGGTRYTGSMRAGASLGINEPLRHGDQLNLDAMTAGHGMEYGRLGYQFTLNGHGTRVGAAYSALTYALAGPLRAIDASGTAGVGSAWVTQPLLRGQTSRVDFRLQVDRKQLRDEIGSATLHNDRHTDSATVSVVGQHTDNWAGGGTSSASLSITQGTLHFDDAAAEAADAASARTAGTFTHWNASVSRLQNLAAGTRLYASLSAQHGRDNLDSSEQFLLGGSDSVRGYGVASVAGDSGWIGTLELRHDLNWGCAGLCVGSVFIDHGALRIDSDPWTSGPNHSHLSSAGVGFTWVGANQWQGQLQIARPIGNDPMLRGKQDDARIWVWLLKGF